MLQETGRPVTHQDVIDAVNGFIADLLDNPPEESSYTYHPGMGCYDVSAGVISAGVAGWTVFIEKAFPEDDGLRLKIADYLEEKFSIGTDVVLEW
jgi:hypothetical protein